MAFGLVAVLLLAFTAFAGDSAAVPGLGAATWHPSWDAGLGLNSATITTLLVLAYLSAAACVGSGLLALRDGAAFTPGQLRIAMIGAISAVLLLTALPPAGSADHLSYLAYGRIAAAGDDPYVQDPLAWHGGTDPVAGAVQEPWQHAPTVYGPVATAAQAVVAKLGGGDLRLTVWFWQLLMGAAFLLTGLILDRLTRHDPRARTRAAILWTLNPLLLGQLVLGGHLDVLAVAAALGAMALAARKPLLAGLFLGVAVGSKITFALFGLAIVIGLFAALPRRTAGRATGLGLLGTALVLVPAHVWAGPHIYDQLRQQSRFISLATPWRLVADLLDPVFGRPAVRGVVGPVAIGLGVIVGILLIRRISSLPVASAGTSAETRRSVSAELPAREAREPAGATVIIIRSGMLLALAWVLTTPYALPWYDAMVWSLLALLGAGLADVALLDLALLARLAVLSLAYVPGRVVGMSPAVEDLTLGFRRHVAPWLTLAVLIAVVVWACASGRWRPRVPPRRATEEPVH